MEDSKAAIANAVKLPKDVVLGEVLISMIGRRSMLVENYRSIILYTDSNIKLQAKHCRLNIEGSRLVIEYYTSDEMKINGMIKSVTFE